jgi:hypothetical protein
MSDFNEIKKEMSDEKQLELFEKTRFKVYKYVTELEVAYIEADTVEEAQEIGYSSYDIYWKNLGVEEQSIPIDEIEKENDNE